MIIYDSNRQVCVGLRNTMLALRLVERQECVAYRSLAPPLSQQVSAERFRNEMALVDTRGGATLYGAEGVSFVFAGEYSHSRSLCSTGFPPC